MTAVGTATPGWYPDPDGARDWRYWTGHSWTDRYRDDDCAEDGYGWELLRASRRRVVVQCLECGYYGPMGVVRGRGAKASWVAIAAAGLVGLLLGPIGIAVAILAGVVIGVASSQRGARHSSYVCPDCDAYLEVD